MFDFGDELTVESYKIPWLIWVQVFVMFLLILLLYCLAFISLDPTHNPNNDSSSSSSSSRLLSEDKTLIRDLTAITNLSQNTQVGEITSLKGEIAPGTSRRVVRRREDVEEDRDDQISTPNMYFHPCHYVRLARVAFLKCLGLDSSSENSSNAQRRSKKKEE